jgi:hypothetical protein
MMAENNSRICAEKKSFLPSALFGLFPPYRTTVLAHFWIFLPTAPLWIMNMDRWVLENQKKIFLDSCLGPKILLQGQKGNFGQKSKKNPIIKKFAPKFK